MDNNSEVYKSFVLLDYFEPHLCAEIRSYLAAAKNAEQLDMAHRYLRDTFVYLVNERKAEMLRRATPQPHAEPPQVFPWKAGDMLRAELEGEK